MSCAHAGKRGTPCLFIVGLSPPVQRAFTALARGKLKVGVALVPALGITYVKALTGTTCASLKPSKTYYTKVSKLTEKATDLTGAEYMDFMSVILQQLKEQGRTVIWVHDRTKAHLGVEVTQQLKDQGHTVMVLPPRSPDLDPLDYAVFGNSKLWLQRNATVQKMSWDDQCTAFVEHLEDLNPSTQLAGFKKRLEMVIQEEGGHFEHKLK